MYAVTFKRKDEQPDEIYYYQNYADAAYHFNLFKDDDSGLYSRIELSKIQEPMELIMEVITFA